MEEKAKEKNEKIKHCAFIDEQPDFLKDVYLDDEKIATIKALTQMDYAKIGRTTKIEQTFEDGKFVQYMIGDTSLMVLTRMLCSLTGHEEVGWRWKREITLDNIGKLNKKIRKALNDAIVKLEASYLDNKEAISKN